MAVAAPAAAVMVRARLLGGFELSVRGRPVPASSFARPSGIRLLKLLLATPGHRLRREEAAELLWPEAEPDRSAASLRKAIHFARRGLAAAAPEAEAIVSADATSLWLDHAEGIDIDADELADAIHAANGDARPTDALDTLVRLGGEELLPDDPYEEWLAPIRERLRQRSLAALLAGATLSRVAGDRGRAFALIERLLALEPAEEAGHRIAIELHLDAGELHAARRQLRACRQAIAEAFGTEPDPALGALIDAAVAARRPAAALARAESPIVGRRHELAAGEAAFDVVAAGGSAAVLFRGSAGIGKSRVLRELAAAARASGWPVLETRGLEDAAEGRFGGIGRAIVDAAGGSLPAELPEPARSAVLTAVPGEAAPTIEFASDEALLGALLQGIGWFGSAGPLALIADDAQWLDSGSLGTITAAIEVGIGGPLFALVAVRDEAGLMTGEVMALVDAIRRRGGEDIAMGSLGPRELQVVVEREAAGDRLDDGLAGLVAELSAGTPLFGIELFRAARDGGLIEISDGRWSLRRGSATLAIPDGITRLVERRMGRLGTEARLVLATAAELGDIVAFEDLVATGVDADTLIDTVDAALAAGIVIEREGRYAFGHPLYRAALRRGLAARDRAAVHQRVANMLARGIDPRDAAAVRRAGATGTDLLAIATHASAAVELGRVEMAALAVGIGLGAGEQQAFRFDFAGAAATIRRALGIWQRMPEDDRAAFPTSQGHVELGQALRRAGDDVGAEAAFLAAGQVARTDGEIATAASASAWLPYEHGRFAAAMATLDAALGRISDPMAVARVQSARAWLLGREGRGEEASRILRDVVRTLADGGPSADLMRALDRLAMVVGDRDAAASIPLLERGLHMAIELGRTGEQATFEMHLAGSLRWAGRLDEAVAALDRARTLCRQAGERYTEAVTEWIAAEVEESRGQLGAAIECRRRELEILRGIGGNARHEALAHAHIAYLARRLGDDGLERTESDAARLGARHSGIEGLDVRVESALATDDWFAEHRAPSGERAGTAAAQPTGDG